MVVKPWLTRAACGAALLWCGVLLVAHMLWGQLICSGDTSACALSRNKDTVYAGRLVDERGRPLPNTRFAVDFPSRKGEPPVDGLRTDATGRYCVLWAFERGSAYARIRMPGQPTQFVRFSPRESTVPGTPAGCVTPDAGIPWNRSDDVTSTWQYRSPQVVAIVAALLLAGGLVLGRIRFALPGCVLAGLASLLVVTFGLISYS
jgi:hypothetical protein